MTQDSPFPQPMPGPGGPVPPVMTSDQIMQHVDQVYQGLPQPVKSALDYAHTRTGGAPSSTLSGVAKAPAVSPDIAPPPVSTVDAGLPTLPQTPIAKPTPGPMQQELSRVTAPPLSGALAHTKADTGLSGVEQIHNPFLRVPLQVLEGAFNTFVPGGRAFTSYIPGTESHHEAIVRSDTNAAKEEQEAQKAADESLQSQALTNKAQADTGAVPSEVTLRKAQAEEANARAESLRNPTKALTPKDKYIPVGDGVFNAESGDWAKEPTDKKLAEVTEIDPEKGKALGLIPNKDGKYLIPNAALGELLKPPTEKPSDEERFIQSFLKEHNLPDNATNRAAAMKERSRVSQAPERPERALIVGPGGKVEEISAGSTVAPGSQTVSGVNQQTSAADKKLQAKKEAAEAAQSAYETAQELAKDETGASDVGLLMQFIGAVKPESMGKIRFTPAEQDFVQKTRSAFGNLDAFANKVANGEKLIPKQRQQMLRTMKIFAEAAQRSAGGESSGGSIRYSSGGKTYNIPVDKEKEFLSDHKDAKKL